MSQLRMSASPVFSDLADSTIAGDHPLNDSAILAISRNAKFGAVRCEVIYMGFYQHGDVVGLPISPVDGYAYSAPEVFYNFQLYSTRRPATGFVSGQSTPPTIAVGQADSPYWFTADINSSRAVQLSVGYADNTTAIHDGIVKVHAVCQRNTSLTLSSAPTFTLIPDDALVAAQPLKVGSASGKYGIQDISHNAKFGAVSREFFNLGFWQSGYNPYTAGRFTSPVDGYVYQPAEIIYKAIFYSNNPSAGSFANGQSTPPTFTNGQLGRRSGKGQLRWWIFDVDQDGNIRSCISYYVQGGAETPFLNDGIFKIIAFGQRTVSYVTTGGPSVPSYVSMPRSAGGVSGVTGNPTLTELWAPDTYQPQCQVEFSVPPTTWETGFSTKTIISSPVITTDGSIAGSQTLYVEVCPKISSAEGLASNYLTFNLPAGTTYKLSFQLALPVEADGYTVRVGLAPGKCYKQFSGAGSGTFTVTVSDISGLDSSSLSPDPLFDHVHVWYYFDSSPNVIHDGGRTSSVTQASLVFDLDTGDPTSTEITVVVQSMNAAEDNWFGFDVCPSAVLVLSDNIAGDSDVPAAPIIGVVPSRLTSGDVRFLVGAERPVTNWHTIRYTRFQVALQSTGFGTLLEDGYKSGAPTTYEYITSLSDVFIFRALCHNEFGDSAWSTTATCGSTGIVQSSDTDVPSVPLDVVIDNKATDASIPGNALRISWKRPEDNFNTLFCFCAQLYPSDTFPSDVVYVYGTGATLRGSTVLTDNATDFNADYPAVDGKNISIYMTGTGVLRQTATVLSHTQHTLTLDAQVSLDSGNYGYKVFTLPAFNAVTRSIDVGLGGQIASPQVGDTDRFSIMVTDLAQGDYYVRIDGANEFGVGPWCTVVGPAAVIGMTQEDLDPVAYAKLAAGYSAYTGTVNYRDDIAPNGVFSNFIAPAHTDRANASCDVTLQFTFAQGSVPASAFLVFFNLTGAASQLTDAAWAIDAKAGTNTYTVIISGINPTTFYSVAVLAFAVTASGRSSTALQAPASWQNFQPSATANFTGTIDGTVASTVKTGAANGQTAFADTAQYRGNLPPTNAANLVSVSFTALRDGAYSLEFSFTYTQGTYKATHFALYVKIGGGAFVVTDPHYLVACTGATNITIKLPVQVSPAETYSYGVGACAVCKDYTAYNNTISSIVNSHSLDVGPMFGVDTKTTSIDGSAIYLLGPTWLDNLLRVRYNGVEYMGVIDLLAYSGKLKMRKAGTGTDPDTDDIESGEIALWHASDGLGLWTNDSGTMYHIVLT